MKKQPHHKKGNQILIKGLLNATKITIGILFLLIGGTFFLIYELRNPQSSEANAADPQIKAEVAAAETTAATPVAEQIVDGKDVTTGLIAGEGLQMVKSNCTACHSSALILQNRFTREGWHEKIVWMQETQGLWDLGENEPVILDYLATHYAPEEALGRRRPLENIEWYRLEN